MGHFFNLIYNNDDKIYDFNKSFLTDIGVGNIRKTSLDLVSENPNESFFFILHSNFVSGNISLDVELRNTYSNHDNVYIVLIYDTNPFHNVKDYKLPNDRLFTVNQNECNFLFFNNLLNIKKRDTLNVVYDKWSEDLNTYYPNLYFDSNEKRYRIVIGFFRFYKMFNDVRNCTLDEVFKNKNENYYYFINGDNISNHFSDVQKFPFSDEVKKCLIECENFNIVLLNEHEYETKKFISLIDSISKREGYDKKRIYLWNNNSKLNQYKEELGTELNVYSLDFLVKFISDHMVQFGEPRFVPEKSGNFFMCHNRSPKPHRYGLLALMMKNNIINEIDWSLVYGWYRKKQLKFNPDYSFYSPIFTKEECDMLKNEIDFLNGIDIKKSNYETEKSWFDDTEDHAQVEWKNIYENRTFENSYVNIVTESCYERSEIHITEKSMKPFYFHQLPIFVSSFNHVKFLRERFGFDLFDDLINHDYDMEPNNKKRLLLVFNEILRLLKNKDKVVEFYKNNEHRFKKNSDIIIKINESKRDEDYFKSLIYKK